MSLDLNTILLVDDEQDILEFVGYNLRKNGFNVVAVNNGYDALERAKELLPGLIILDVMMPEMDGIETCEELRKVPDLRDTVIAMLSARGEDYSQIAGFDAGADDYIKKPIRPNVLVTRVKALLRRLTSPQNPETLLHFKDFQIDKDKYAIIRGDKEIMLPRKEFELLLLLTSKPNKVFTREEILKSIWGEEIVVGDRTIDVHIRKIREKIGIDYIKTFKGVGYSFC
jgi:two-component system alkaline phosphatase synthesis response regulator PhoP